jgi:hypothetical protein
MISSSLIAIGHVIAGNPFIILDIVLNATTGFSTIVPSITTIGTIPGNIMANRCPQYGTNSRAYPLIALVMPQLVTDSTTNYSTENWRCVGISMLSGLLIADLLIPAFTAGNSPL